MRTLTVAALLLSVIAAGCAKPQPEPPLGPRWDDGHPAWTPGWTLSYAAPADAESPAGRWANFTYRGDETVRHLSHGNETANWTAHRMDVLLTPGQSDRLDETLWYDVETKGIVQMRGAFTLTATCPLQDVRIVAAKEWTCRASSWTLRIHQEQVGETMVVLAGKAWTERKFDYRTTVNNEVFESTFAYSPELGFFTRLTMEEGSSAYVLQRMGACRGSDGMLMPDPSACGPWPEPSLS